MNINLAKAVANLSRLGIPVNIKSNKVEIIGTTIEVKQKKSSITIQTANLPEIDLDFGQDNFNVELFTQRVIQALMNEASELNKFAIQGIYNSLGAEGLVLNELYIENHEKQTTAIILPLQNSLTVAVFYGPMGTGAIKSTLVMPLANDPLAYVKIIKGLM